MNEGDIKLIQQCKNGSDSAFDILIDKYDPLIKKQTFKYLFSFLNLGVTEDEIAQEAKIAFLKAVKKYDVNKEVNIGVYATRIIENALKDLYRQKKREREKTFPIDFNTNSLSDALTDNTSPQSIHEEKVDSKKLRTLLETLFDEFELKVWDLWGEGRKYKEIAEMLKVDTKKIDNTIQKIKRIALSNKDKLEEFRCKVEKE